MKELFIKLTGFGIKPDTAPDIAEQTRLVNGISFLGVPICLTYVLLFSLTGYYYHALAFSSGILIFTIPLFLNKYLSLNVGRVFVAIGASVFFGAMSVLSGKDLGFYLGFLVVSVPPILVFDTVRKGLVYTLTSVFFLILSILGNIFIEPICEIPFAMGIYLFNLFTVMATTITVVAIFKIELSESRHKLAEKNKDITDSINYAQRIQKSLLPTDKAIDKILEKLKDKN